MGILQNALGPGYNCYLRPSQILALKKIKLITHNCTLETLTLSIWKKYEKFEELKVEEIGKLKELKLEKEKKHRID